MAIGQAGSITTNSPTENAPIQIILDEPLTDPVFAFTSTNNGGHQFVIRVVDTQTNADGDVVSFDVIMEEWEYLDGAHPATETINWIAIEEGVHTLSDGRVIEAGTVSTNPGSGNTAVNLNGSFTDAPVVMTSVMSNNDTTTVDSDPLNITSSGFNIQMQEEEAQNDDHASETVGYIAIQGGGSSANGTANTYGNLDHTTDTFSLGDTFNDAIVIGETQTINGGNPGTVEIDGQTNSTVNMHFEEEQSWDNELNHIDETVGIVAFERGLILCFGPDAIITTDRGPTPVGTLSKGDRILTRDSGMKSLSWLAHSHLSATDLAIRPELAPVRLAAGALGNGLPQRPLTLSPQHRILFSGWQAELFFGEAEVLIPAKALINGTTITQSIPPDGIDYFHLLFDRHEVVESNGLWSESLFPAQLELAYLSSAAQRELHQIFPDLRQDLASYGQLARPSVTVREARVLAA